MPPLQSAASSGNAPNPPTAHSGNDDKKYLEKIHGKLHEAGQNRFDELAHEAEVAFKRKMANVPSQQHDQLLQEFMKEMQSIAMAQEEEVQARYAEEEREMAWSRSLGLSLGMAESDVAGSAGVVDQTIVDEQRRLWDAVRKINSSSDDEDSDGDDSSGSSTEEETEGRKWQGGSNSSLRTSGGSRARSETTSPTRNGPRPSRTIDQQQKSKSATVSPTPAKRPELTFSPPVSVYSITSSVSHSNGNAKPSTLNTTANAHLSSGPTKPFRRRTQSTSSTRELEAKISVSTVAPASSRQHSTSLAPPDSHSASTTASKDTLSQQKHKVWIPPKPAHMTSSSSSIASQEPSSAGAGSKGTVRPRPISHTASASAVTTLTSASSSPSSTMVSSKSSNSITNTRSGSATVAVGVPLEADTDKARAPKSSPTTHQATIVSGKNENMNERSGKDGLSVPVRPQFSLFNPGFLRSTNAPVTPASQVV